MLDSPPQSRFAVALAAGWRLHWPLPLAGCKMESIFLNVAAVNTHRDRPQVALGSLPGWWARSLGCPSWVRGRLGWGVSLLLRLFSVWACLLWPGCDCGLVRFFPRSALRRCLELGHQQEAPRAGCVWLPGLTVPRQPCHGSGPELVPGEGEASCPPVAGGDSQLPCQARLHEHLYKRAPLNFTKDHEPGHG